MGLRINNFKIFGLHWKIQFSEGEAGGSQKTNIKRGDCLKRGLGQFADLRGALARNRGWF